MALFPLETDVRSNRKYAVVVYENFSKYIVYDTRNLAYFLFCLVWVFILIIEASIPYMRGYVVGLVGWVGDQDPPFNSNFRETQSPER